MSRKVNVFKTILGTPLAVHKFLVIIPGAMRVSFLVESATYPSSKLGEVAIPHRGGKIYRPTQPEFDGTWKARVPEDQGGFVRAELFGLQAVVHRANVDEKTIAVPLPAVGLVAQPVVYVTQMVKQSPPRMEGWSMDRGRKHNKFYRQIQIWILDEMDIPIMGVNLMGAWLKGKDPVDLNNQDPTVAWKWNLEFKYTSTRECLPGDILLARSVTTQII